MPLKIFNAVFFIIFLGFAYVNLNDPDAWLWVGIYMAAAICCGMAVFKRFYPKLYLIICAFYFVYAGIIFFYKDGVWDWIVKYHTPGITETMKAEKPWIESTREFFGLLIAAGALLINFFAAGRVKGKKSALPGRSAEQTFK